MSPPRRGQSCSYTGNRRQSRFQNFDFFVNLKVSGHLFHILGIFSFDDIDHVVDGDDSDDPLFSVHHGHRNQVVFLEPRGDHLLVVMCPREDDGRRCIGRKGCQPHCCAADSPYGSMDKGMCCKLRGIMPKLCSIPGNIAAPIHFLEESWPF